MNQQERILNLAQEQIVCIGQGGTRQCGKSFKAGFDIAVKFTLENLWIPVDESLPVLVDKKSGQSEVVFAMVDYDNVFVAYYDYSNEHWYYNNHYGYDPQIYCEVTHWMPFPVPMKGGEK